MTTIPNRSWPRCRRLFLGLLLLTVPACGLSEYEGLMHKAQERANHYRDELKYLDAPVFLPTAKNKDGKDVPLADVFFQPPKGIVPTPQDKPLNGLIWQYLPGPRGSEFVRVEVAFDEDDKNFASNVVNSYPRGEQVPTPERKPPLPFDSWEYNDSQNGYSINIYKGGAKKIAIVFIFRRDKRDALRKTIDLSLQSLTEKVGTARQRYNQKSPWKLE